MDTFDLAFWVGSAFWLVLLLLTPCLREGFWHFGIALILFQ
jgi:hypothetical protein